MQGVRAIEEGGAESIRPRQALLRWTRWTSAGEESRQSLGEASGDRSLAPQGAMAAGRRRLDVPARLPVSVEGKEIGRGSRRGGPAWRNGRGTSGGHRVESPAEEWLSGRHSTARSDGGTTLRRRRPRQPGDRRRGKGRLRHQRVRGAADRADPGPGGLVARVAGQGQQHTRSCRAVGAEVP